MEYRDGLDIKKALIHVLKERGYVISQLERKINTSSSVLHRHIRELEYLKIVEMIKHEKSSKTGRPYTMVKLTNYGKTVGT